MTRAAWRGSCVNGYTAAAKAAAFCNISALSDGQCPGEFISLGDCPAAVGK
jgi:hypothetical protein